jgi:hypothetical protein
METPEVLPDPIVIAPSCLARWQRRTAHASIIAYSMCTHGQGAELQKDEGGRWLAVLSLRDSGTCSQDRCTSGKGAPLRAWVIFIPTAVFVIYKQVQAGNAIMQPFLYWIWFYIV